MFVMLNKLKTSAMTCSFCSLNIVHVRVTRVSNELKSSPNFRFGFTWPSTAMRLPMESTAWHGTWLTPLHDGNAFHLSMAVFSWVPFEISRPRALRASMGSRVPREPTNESMATCEPYVQMGDIVSFHGTSKTPST